MSSTAATTTAPSATHRLDVDGAIGIVTVAYPPVNALSRSMRQAIIDGIAAAQAHPAVQAIVFICDGRTFLAGADITEFGKPPQAPSLFEVQNVIENSAKPVIAAIHGTSLCGLPEVHLGLRPGAGGTQRLPRIGGGPKALEFITNGTHVPAQQCLEIGLVDAIVPEGQLRDGAVAFARQVLAEGRPLRKVRDADDKVLPARGKPELFAEFRQANAKRFRGFLAPEYNIRCIEAAANLPFDEGQREERRLFMELVTGAQSIAQRYGFFAERMAQKIPDVPADTPTVAV
ncbi:MAG: 3-hydroxyacyl-CoA dehydrogenase, partial [Burkholderiales bacterium PBB5]